MFPEAAVIGREKRGLDIWIRVDCTTAKFRELHLIVRRSDYAILFKVRPYSRWDPWYPTVLT